MANPVKNLYDQSVLVVRTSVGFSRLEDYRLYQFSGPDAARFLQNRLSNDVLALQAGQGQLNAVLDRQGKIEGVFSLHCVAENRFYLLVHQSEAEAAIQGIEKYHIMEQFQIEEQSAQWCMLTVQGPQALMVLKSVLTDCSLLVKMSELGFAHCTWQTETLEVIQRSFSGELGYVVLVPLGLSERLYAEIKTAAEALGGVEMTLETREVLRIEAGLPRFELDYTHETLLPETGLERLAVSYSKGCYLGQETIARIKTYGIVQKALAGLLFEPESTLPPAGTACLLEGKPVGILQSGTYSPTLQRPIAFAYLSKTERIPGRVLCLEMDGQLFQVMVTLLPFYDGQAAQKSGAELLGEGLKLFSDGFDEEAIRILRQAIEKAPDLLDAYEALGVILSRHERYEEAIMLMEKVLMLDPDHVLAHTNLSVFYMKLGDKDKAEAEKAKATMAAFSRKAMEAGLSFDLEAEQRKKEQALLEKITMFQEALRYHPEDPLGNFGLGTTFLELKRYEEAIPPLETVLRVQPKHSVAYLSLGKAWQGLSDLERAQQIYQKGIEVAAAKGDLMPLKEMQMRLAQLSSSR